MANNRPLPDILKQTGPIKERRQRVRVGVLCIRNNKVFLLKSIIDHRPVWFLPGGSVDWGETLAEAVLREAKEELDVKVEILNIVSVSDAISELKDYHSIEVIFLCKLFGEPKAQGEAGGENETTNNQYCIEGSWFSLPQLENIEAYPKKFLKIHLAKLLLKRPLKTSYLGLDFD